MRQSELAKRVGISASYLNLIEHGRRRIGGRILVAIARELGVAPSALTEGAEAALVAELREIAADSEQIAQAGQPETERAEDFAGRFPFWAERLVSARRRIVALEEMVQTLLDRLTHDPQLAESVHELLTSIATIRSSAAILAGPEKVDDAWRDRFSKNIDQAARKLAESSRTLVAYLDGSSDGSAQAGSGTPGLPREEVEAFLAGSEYAFPAIERGDATPAEIVAEAPQLTSRAARELAERNLEAIAEDARRLPVAKIAAAVAELGVDPLAISRACGEDLPTVFRRLATLPPDSIPAVPGLVICDASGAILFGRSVPGFAIPRSGAACPLWPMFLALSRPLVPIRRRVVQLGRGAGPLDCMAIAWPEQAGGFDDDPVYRAAMLVLPAGNADDADDAGGLPSLRGRERRPRPLGAAELPNGSVRRPGRDGVSAQRGPAPETPGPQEPLEVGSSCQVCPREACAARREMSFLQESRLD